MAKKKENLTDEILEQEAVLAEDKASEAKKDSPKRAASKKSRTSENEEADSVVGEENSDAENEEALAAQEMAAKFDEKCKGLLALAKKKKNVLDYQEIMNYFLDTDFEADKMEKVFEFLEVNNVDVKMSDDEEDDDEIILDDEEEINIEKIDLSVPDGVGLEDPV